MAVRRLSMGIAVLACWASVASAGWQVVYQTDFSSDPGWTTNSSSHFYWDSVSASYYQQRVNGSGEYAYVILPGLQQDWQWRLEFDVKPVSNDWAANVTLSLTDSNMSYTQPYTMSLSLAFTSLGYNPWLEWSDTGGFGQTQCGSGYDLETWYHAVLQWNPDTGILYSTVVRKSDGALIGEAQSNGRGPFANIDRLAITAIDHTYASGAAAIGYIDNIVVSQVPEPATLSLLALGGLALIRRRRKP